MEDKFLVAVTAIVRKDGRFLITKRSPNKKRFPNRWTVPGGRVGPQDFISQTVQDENWSQWYNVLINAVKREVKEETDLEVDNVKFLCDLVFRDKITADTLVISFVVDWQSGDVSLQTEETDDYAWVTAEEAKQYDLIEGIQEELEKAHVT